MLTTLIQLYSVYKVKEYMGFVRLAVRLPVRMNQILRFPETYNMPKAVYYVELPIRHQERTK